jgi:hypothetical protein
MAASLRRLETRRHQQADRFGEFEQQGEGENTRRRLAHERRSQIARINTALSNYFSVLRAIHLHSTQKLSFQSWLNESER